MALGCHFFSNQVLKDKFTPKQKFSYCVLAFVVMASQVKLCSLQNISKAALRHSLKQLK